MSIQNNQPDSKQQPSMLVDPGMLQFALAIAVIGFFFTSSSSEYSRLSGAFIFLGSSFVTIALFFIYIAQWGVHHIPAFEEIVEIKHNRSIMAVLALFFYVSIAGAILAAIISSILVLDISSRMAVIVSFACVGIPLFIFLFGGLLLSLKIIKINRN